MDQREVKPTKPASPPRTLPQFLLMLWREIVIQKRWALIPLWILLAMIGLLLILTGNPHLLPAIYIAF